MNTKEKIQIESLKLFSKYGYAAVTTQDIAKAVGIKDASIYAHYKTKQDIFTSIIESFYIKVKEVFCEVLSPENVIGVDFKTIRALQDNETLLEMVLTAYLPFITDEYLVCARRLLTIEQYGNNEAKLAYKQMFIETPLQFNQELFSYFVEVGYFKPCNTKAAARQFFAPAMMLMNEYDHNCITYEELRKNLDDHISQFNKIYKKQ